MGVCMKIDDDMVHGESVVPHAHAKRDCRGMTVLELMIVVSIIGLLAVIAIPAFTRARLISQNVSFANDLRQLSGNVFDLYALDNGDLPPDSAPGAIPAGVESYLPKNFDWAEPTPIGGIWNWERAADRSEKVYDGLCYGGLAIISPGRTTSQMMDVDDDIDDGDLNTGMFRSVGGGIYVLIIDP